MKVEAKKKFGQNFLQDNNVVDNIALALDIDDKTGVIEIGPGTGNLTNYLFKYAKRVLAYEIDKDLISNLKDRFKDKDFILKNIDILEANINQDIKEYFSGFERIVIVGNLPYYITSPIILGLLEQNLNVAKYVFMVQDEVADRLTANQGKKDYNALSVLINYKMTTKKLFRVAPTCFLPVPKVWSAVISFIPKENDLKPLNEEYFLKLNRKIFAQRRKTLYNNLLGFIDNKDLIKSMYQELNLKETIRSEELSVNDIIKISDYFWGNK